MVIYGNSVLWVFCILKLKYPKISNSNSSNRLSELYYEYDYPRIVREEVLFYEGPLRLLVNTIEGKITGFLNASLVEGIVLVLF